MSQNKKIAYIDLDGVLADFESTLYRLFPHLIHFEHGSPELGKQVDEMCASPEGRRIFYELQPMPYAVETFELLCEHYEVYILSTPMWGVPESYTDKRLWVDKVFGPKAHKKLILSHNKGLNAGDYLIDDRIKNGVENFKGRHFHYGQEGCENFAVVVKTLSELDGWKYVGTSNAQTNLEWDKIFKQKQVNDKRKKA